MDRLFTNNCLKNWSIFEETSGSTVVRLRFTKNGDNNVVTSPQSFRRKSETQAQRDRDRAARHRDARTGATTRSQASADRTLASESPELARHSETISAGNTAPSLEVSPVQLNASAECFDPESVDHNSAAGDGSTNGNTSLLSLESMDTYSLDMMPSEYPDDSTSIVTESIIEEPSYTSYAGATGIINHKGRKEILCRRCHATVAVASAVYGIKMMHCDKCKVHVCEKTSHFHKCREHVRFIDT